MDGYKSTLKIEARRSYGALITLTRLYCLTTEKATVDISSAVKTSNLMSSYHFTEIHQLPNANSSFKLPARK